MAGVGNDLAAWSGPRKPGSPCCPAQDRREGLRLAGSMEEHLERALIEAFFAIAEFDQKVSAPDWRLGAMETDLLARALYRSRASLEALLDQLRGGAAASFRAIA
jgi:hypothetical protein